MGLPIGLSVHSDRLFLEATTIHREMSSCHRKALYIFKDWLGYETKAFTIEAITNPYPYPNQSGYRSLQMCVSLLLPFSLSLSVCLSLTHTPSHTLSVCMFLSLFSLSSAQSLCLCLSFPCQALCLSATPAISFFTSLRMNVCGVSTYVRTQVSLAGSTRWRQ